MSKKLFTTAPIKKASYNVIVGGAHASRYAYINGYYEAAKILADKAIEISSKNILFYPICFNYRHYLELHLKSLINEEERLYFKMDKLGYTKGVLLKAAKDELSSIHSLEVLFKMFEERLTLVSDEIFDANIKKTIMQLHSTDSDGQVYRYHEKTNNKASLPDTNEYDLKNIADKMKEVRDLLYGVDTWLDHYIGMSDDMIYSMEENYY